LRLEAAPDYLPEASIRFPSQALQGPILPAKLFHPGDRRKRRDLIGGEIAEAVIAKTDCRYCLQFFVVKSAKSNGNVIALGLVTIDHGCV
jgi:hypothetical protein